MLILDILDEKILVRPENHFENTQPELQPQEVTPAATVAAETSTTSSTTTSKPVSRLIDFWQTLVADKSSGYPQFVAADDNKDEEYDDDDDQWTADEIFVSDEDDIQDEYIEDAYFGEDYYTTYEGY